MIDVVETVKMIENKLIVHIPFPSTDFLFYRLYSDRLEIGNDLRLFYTPEVLLDTSGLYSLLQFGVIAPPRTIFEEVKAFVPGLCYTISLDDMSIQVECDINWSSTLERDKTLCEEEQIEILSNTIRRKLKELCPDDEPIVLFSGGVDSGLLAAELVTMGWDRTRLFHYSFDKHDPETLLAQSMAKELGLECCVILDGQFNEYEVLDNAAIIYPFPFCDHSCLPTYSLAQGVIQNHSPKRLILDGTGADGSFGLFNKANQLNFLYKIPRAIRMSVGEIYRQARLWEHTSPWEYYARLSRRSSQLPILANSVAQNALLGIGFNADKSVIDAAIRETESWIRAISPSDNYTCLIPIIDIALVCCGIFAQKNKSVFNNWGATIAYPYLSRELVDLSLQHVRLWPGTNRTAKNALKKLLSYRIPRNMVYRKKSPFVASPLKKFSDLRFLKHFESVLDTKSCWEMALDRRILERLYFLVRAKSPLPAQTYNFIWAVTFSSCWIFQLMSFFQNPRASFPNGTIDERN